MSRILISAAAIFALLFPSLILPPAALACEEEPPSTLLSLYESSDEVHVAVYRKVEDVEILETTEDYSRVKIRKHYDISSTLRGQSRKLTSLDEDDYRYANTEEAAMDDHSSMSPEDVVKTGDRVLLFLKKSEDGKTMEPAHYRDAVKKMSEQNLSAYETRIRELNGIFAKTKNRDAEIVEWLIRLIEDPITRWEGAFELSQGFQSIEWEEEAAKERAESKTEAPADEDTEAYESRGVKYARLLTPEQKQRISAVLLKNDSPAEGDKDKKSAFAPGDMALIELVKRWGDTNVADFLVQRLRNGGDDRHSVSSVMFAVSAILKDDGVKTSAELYGENSWQEDTDVVGEEANGETVEEPAKAESEDGSESTENPEPKKQTYLELRAEIFGKFLAAADSALSKAKNKEIAKAVK